VDAVGGRTTLDSSAGNGSVLGGIVEVSDHAAAVREMLGWLGELVGGGRAARR